MSESDIPKEEHPTPAAAVEPSSAAKKTGAKKRGTGEGKEKKPRQRRAKKPAEKEGVEKPEEVVAAELPSAEKPEARPKRTRAKAKEVAKQGSSAADLNERALQALREYIVLGVTFDELAAKYGLSGWEELFELYKKTPAWQMWQAAG